MTGKSNPTRLLYEFVEPEWEEEVLELTAGTDIGLIVIHRTPGFTEPMSSATSKRLARRFPQAVRIGPMAVRWRAKPQHLSP